MAWISFSCIYVVARAPSICRLSLRLALASDCQRVSNPRPSEPCDGCALPKGTGTPLPGEGRNVARSERIYCTPETNATMNSGMLRLIARRRYCRVIRACAMHTHDGEVESDGYEQPAQLEMHPDIRVRMVFMPGGTSNLVRNAVRRRVLGERTIRQQVQRRQLELLALLSRRLHISVHRCEMVCKLRNCGTLSLAILPAP